MRKIMLLGFAPALFLAGCQTPVTVGEPVVPSKPTCSLTANTLVDEKALYTAESAYNIAAHAYVTLASRDQLPTALKETVKGKLQADYSYLTTARAAYKAGDTCDFYAALDVAKVLASEAKSLLPSDTT